MSSSPSPSPSQASQMATEEGFLSPNAKIAKMLADIDEQFDGDAGSPIVPKTSNVNPPASSQMASTDSTEQTSEAFEASKPTSVGKGPFQQESDSEQDESEDEIRRPQGRAARRMLEHDKPVSATAVSSTSAAIQPTNDDDEDLYFSTPQKQTQHVRQPSESPIGPQRGDGLFVSPAKSAMNDESDDDLPANVLGGADRLKELVAQKRAERLAKEAEEESSRKQHSSDHLSSDLPEGDLEGSQDGPVDPNVERIMSDASRPARKASKKALQEMERETQRLARQQALAHQMKTRTKFTTTDFLAKFNNRQSKTAAFKQQEPLAATATDSSSAPNSDGIEESTVHPVSTPPSSPPTPLDRQKALANRGALSKLVPVRQDSIASVVEADSDEELPDMAQLMAATQARKAAQALPAAQPVAKDAAPKGLKLARLGKKPAPLHVDLEDDDLEILAQMPAHLRMFDKAVGLSRKGKPAESKALHNLKHLSNLHASEGVSKKKGGRPSINPIVLEAQLRRQAKEQARQQQLERIEELKAKGIFVQSVEEREKEAEAFESLLERARQEAVALRKAEKKATKDGDEGALQASDDEEEDGDYEESGSDDEDGNDEIDGVESNENEMVDDAAEENDEEEEEEEEEKDEADGMEDEVDEETEVPDDEAPQPAVEEAATPSQDLAKKRDMKVRNGRKSRVVEDEEDDEELGTLEPANEANTAVPNVAEEQEDPFAAFNFGAAAQGDMLLSPTQAFNATMRTPTQMTQEDSMEIFNRIAPLSASSLPSIGFGEALETPGEAGNIAGSQVPESQRVDLNWETQAPETPVPAGLQRDTSALSETPGWEPTQDDGLPSPWPIRGAASREDPAEPVAEYDTQSTVQLRVSESPAPSQHVSKRGRLIRRQIAFADESSDEEGAAQVKPDQRNAFREMARKRKEALSTAERQEAEKEMRGMMDEQAEESEDEYAGLGGDDYVAPETEQDREMIDSSHVDVDERALAAHYAERERLREEEETSRLYKDLTTGVLRRKMGANAFDLDEDEDELALRRRQMRQREEARKRKALLKDENIATLADGRQSKGKDAFLKAIADNDGDEDMVNLSDDDADQSGPATQDDSQPSQTQRDPLQETTGNKRRMGGEEDLAGERAPAKQRRTQLSAFKRPTSLLEVQESVSFLLEDQNSHVPSGSSSMDAQSGSESEHEEEPDPHTQPTSEDEAIAEEANRENDGGYAPDQPLNKRMPPPPSRLPAAQRRTAASVVDRLSLKRNSSASSSDSAHSRTAWAAGPTTGGFKVPSLLRRATTSSAAVAAAEGNDRGVTTSTGLSRENSGGAGGVKMGGSKKSSLAYQARAEERRAIVEASAKRREENTRKIAEMRRSASVSGLLGRGFGGRFE